MSCRAAERAVAMNDRAPQSTLGDLGLFAQLRPGARVSLGTGGINDLYARNPYLHYARCPCSAQSASSTSHKPLTTLLCPPTKPSASEAIGIQKPPYEVKLSKRPQDAEFLDAGFVFIDNPSIPTNKVPPNCVLFDWHVSKIIARKGTKHPAANVDSHRQCQS